MPRTLAELGRDPIRKSRRQHRREERSERFCAFCGRNLSRRGTSRKVADGYACRRPCPESMHVPFPTTRRVGWPARWEE